MPYSSFVIEFADKVWPIPPPTLGLFSSPITSWFLMFGRLTHNYFNIHNTILKRISRGLIELLRLLSDAGIPFPGFLANVGYIESIIPNFPSSNQLFLSSYLGLLMGFDSLLGAFQRPSVTAPRQPAVLNTIVSSRPFRWLTSLRRLLWAIFWGWYFTSSNAPEFHQDFLEAWQRWLQKRSQTDQQQQQQQQEPCSFMVFLDNESMIEGTCFPGTKDRDFFAYLQALHELARVEKDIFYKFSLQVLGRVDIAEVAGNEAVGELVRTMVLGRVGGNRQVHLLSHHEHLEGNCWVRALMDDGVIQGSGSAKTHCLNLTSTWSNEAIGSIAGTPLLWSLLSCIVWPVVAVLKYGADVQTSIQTGVTIAGFVVTASAFLIALVAFLDTTGSRETGNSSRKQGTEEHRSRLKSDKIRALRRGKGRFRVVRSKHV